MLASQAARLLTLHLAISELCLLDNGSHYDRHLKARHCGTAKLSTMSTVHMGLVHTSANPSQQSQTGSAFLS